MRAFGDPRGKALAGLSGRVGGDPAGVEAERARPGA
jgi:hypothetical protein